MSAAPAKKRRKSPPPRETIKVSLSNAISAGWDDMTEIKGELDDWRSNMEERLSNSPKYAELEEAVGELEGIEEADTSGVEEIEGIVGDIAINLYKWTKRGLSRQKRLENAAAYWECAAEEIEAVVSRFDDLDYDPEDEEFDETEFEEDDLEFAKLISPIKDTLQELADNLRSGSETMCGTLCPGMY